MYTSSGFERDKANVKTDFSKLRRILTNLVGNAVKFTHKGKIVFGYKIMDKNIEFFVKDSGIGIKTEDHEAIFERFRQAGDLKHSEYGGNGLGLSIAKAYVEMLGGKSGLFRNRGKALLSFSPLRITLRILPLPRNIKLRLKSKFRLPGREKARSKALRK